MIIFVISLLLFVIVVIFVVATTTRATTAAVVVEVVAYQHLQAPTELGQDDSLELFSSQMFVSGQQQ